MNLPITLRRKAWHALMVAAVAVVAAGCLTLAVFRTGPASVTAADPATIRLLLPGEASADFPLVMQEAEKRLRKELNLRIEVKFVPWNDYGRTSQVLLASGTDLDLVFDAPWLHLGEMIASGFYAPLDDLLSRYGPAVLAKRPEKMWEANRVSGKIMAVPLGNSYQMGHSYYVRKDIREKLGIPPIRSYDELIRFAYEVKEKLPGMTPLIAAGSPSQQLYSLAAFRHYDDPTQIRPTEALSRSLMLYYQGNDGKVHNVLKEKDSPVRAWIAEARRLYVDGIMDANVLGVKDFQSPGRFGTVAAFPTGNLGVSAGYQQKVREHAPQAEYESLTFYRPARGEAVSDFAQWNFLAVPVRSGQKEAAIQFLNWANTKENYDLLAYGLEGVHWEADGPDGYRQLSNRYAQAPFVWLWNPTDDRLLKEEGMAGELERALRDPDFFQPDLLTGFAFDPAPVLAELNRYVRLEAEFYSPLFNGVVDPEATFVQLEREAGPALDAIQTELQRQIQSFLAGRSR
ncbi:hypothetical protein J31TS4_28800 [Paenibacillus sp. J31TS4]|uniref:extracellular solute-binding protein n=1 Tax=Paenibacillus sp. J31TS4 TaxID=2807195 RepID=UPI001B0DC56C|nr:extracellular solute-binding protein [Paenibacillus sp. J31TS4]GIP39600.1 hypothetical protein J31TS4_28800 [Paenibacillus sp. J31TS4]